MEEHNNMINVGQRAEMDHQEFKKNHAWTESSLSLYPNYPLYNVVVILFAYFTSPHLLALLHYNHRPFFKKVKINQCHPPQVHLTSTGWNSVSKIKFLEKCFHWFKFLYDAPFNPIYIASEYTPITNFTFRISRFLNLILPTKLTYWKFCGFQGGGSCSKKLHLQSYLEMLWSETGYFELLGKILYCLLSHYILSNDKGLQG